MNFLLLVIAIWCTCCRFSHGFECRTTYKLYSSKPSAMSLSQQKAVSIPASLDTASSGMLTYKPKRNRWMPVKFLKTCLSILLLSGIFNIMETVILNISPNTVTWIGVFYFLENKLQGGKRGPENEFMCSYSGPDSFLSFSGPGKREEMNTCPVSSHEGSGDNEMMRQCAEIIADISELDRKRRELEEKSNLSSDRRYRSFRHLRRKIRKRRPREEAILVTGDDLSDILFMVDEE